MLDAQTGEVLVLASYPTYDPNRLEDDWELLTKASNAPLLNRATQGIFAIGALADLLVEIQRIEGYTSLEQTVQNLELAQEIFFILPSTEGILPSNLPEKRQEIGLSPLHIAILGGHLLESRISPTLTIVNLDNDLEKSSLLLKSETARELFQPEFKAFVSEEITGNQPLSWYLGLNYPHPRLVTVVVATAPDIQPDLATKIAAEIY